MTSLFHQLGHNYIWSIDSFCNGVGDGIILGPRYMEMEKVIALPAWIRQQAMFDPQFYLPNSSEGFLSTYPFFPRVLARGFSTTEWTAELAYESAFRCLDFQAQMDFSSVVIPTRFTEGMPGSYIENQTQLFVDPFVQACREQNIQKPCLLQLVLNDQMIKDQDYRRNLLNWATGIEDLGGVYLIFPWSSNRKQIIDIEFLISVMTFVHHLKATGMTVILGYMNTESLLYLASDPDAVTMGSYENLRMFGIRPYQPKEEKTIRGPNARIYASQLLQWIEHEYLGTIIRSIPNGGALFDDNEHRLLMFEPSYKWHFSKPEPYKHYFSSFSQQFHRLITYTGHDRFDAIRYEVQRAIRNYRNLEDAGVVFNIDSSGNHLGPWMTALNQFESTI
jgi:hypothetical protein